MFIQTLLDTRTLSVFEDVKCVNMIWALKIIAEELELVLTKDSSWNMLQTPSLSFPIPAHVPYSQPTKAAPPPTHTPASSHWPLTLAPSVLSSEVLINVTAMFHLTI